MNENLNPNAAEQDQQANEFAEVVQDAEPFDPEVAAKAREDYKRNHPDEVESAEESKPAAKKYIPNTNPDWGLELPDGDSNSLVDKYGRSHDDGYNFDERDDDEEE